MKKIVLFLVPFIMVLFLSTSVLGFFPIVREGNYSVKVYEYTIEEQCYNWFGKEICAEKEILGKTAYDSDAEGTVFTISKKHWYLTENENIIVQGNYIVDGFNHSFYFKGGLLITMTSLGHGELYEYRVRLSRKHDELFNDPCVFSPIPIGCFE